MPTRSVLVVGVAVLMLLASGCDWLQPGYDPGHSGANPSEPALSTATVATLTRQFSISSAGRTYGQPIVAGHTLYATSLESSTSTARLEQFDAANGTPGWSTTLSTSAGFVTDAASASGTIYAATTSS